MKQYTTGQPSSSRATQRCAYALALLAPLAWSSAAEAAPKKRGLQLEGTIGGTGCIPGRAPCSQEGLALDGSTYPSFGTGGAIGARPVKWFLLGAIYRFGMFHPAYRSADGNDYEWGGQHTVGFLMRPILPLGRVDLGLNLSPGYSRQIFKRERGNDRDLSQGFAFLVGPTFDFFLTDNFFIGAGIDFIFNTQKRVCEVRGGSTSCSTNSVRSIAPTHQVIYGLRLGGTFG